MILVLILHVVKLLGEVLRHLLSEVTTPMQFIMVKNRLNCLQIESSLWLFHLTNPVTQILVLTSQV